MKLHLPCALRGALLACFALASVAPAWAVTDIVINGSDPILIKSGTETEYTIKPGVDGISIDNISIKDSITLNVGDTSSKFTSIEIAELFVNDQKNLTVNVAAGTTLYLSNVNFTGSVNYVLGDGATVYITASDCTAGCFSGNGSVYLTDGVIDATKVPLSGELGLWFSGSERPKSGGFLTENFLALVTPFTAESSSITYGIAPGQAVEFNVSSGSGILENGTAGYDLTWKGAGTRFDMGADSPSVIIDKDAEVYRDGAAGAKYWYLHLDESVQNLQGGTLGDIADKKYLAMEKDDAIRFAGGTLTSSANATVEGPIQVEGDSKVILAPAAKTTLTFKNGDGALSNGNGLELCGGEGSTVVLQNVKTAAPENITFTTKDISTTLAISGPGTLTLDAGKNTFLASSNLRKDDGGTLNYLAKAGDSIGSLTNAKGLLSIGRSATATDFPSLDADTLTADWLQLASDGLKVTAETVTVGDLTLNNSMNGIITLTADDVTATRNVTIGNWSKVTTDTLNAKGGLELASGAQLIGNSIKADGTSSITGSVMSGSITLTGNDGAAAEAKKMLFKGNELSLDSLSNAMVTVAATRAASTPTLSIGSLSNSVIDAQGDTILSNATITGSTITAANKLTLSNTKHGSDSKITIANTGTLKNATILKDGGITVGGSSYTVVNVNQAALSGTATAGTLSLTAARVDLTGLTEEITNPVTIVTGTTGSVVKGSSFSFTFDAEPGMAPTARFVNGELVFTLKDKSDVLVRELADSDPILSGAAENLIQYHDNGVLRELFDYTRNFNEADEDNRRAALEAIASGSISMLASSQRQGVTNTINRMRNRVVQMGNPQGNEPEKNIHAWIEADGSYDDIDQDGTYAGYEYQTYGGTVGMHADVGNYSFGAALSASYGDLTAHSNDHAEGDHDSYHLSLFARHQKGSWMQMGILSVGRNSIEMERSINAPMKDGSSKVYDASGDASGYSLTAYYELGYTVALNEECTHVLQPLVSVMLTSAHMGTFSESGTIGNAGLCADSDTFFYGTLGIGARYQVVLAEDVNERLSFLELRAKLVQDIGDETDEVQVGFVGAPGSGFTVRGADVGRTGVQIGAGLSVPTSLHSTLFVDADADFRSGATSISGSVGVRVQF